MIFLLPMKRMSCSLALLVRVTLSSLVSVPMSPFLHVACASRGLFNLCVADRFFGLNPTFRGSPTFFVLRSQRNVFPGSSKTLLMKPPKGGWRCLMPRSCLESRGYDSISCPISRLVPPASPFAPSVCFFFLSTNGPFS